MRQLQTIRRSLSSSLSRSFLGTGIRCATTALPDRNITQQHLRASKIEIMFEKINPSQRKSIAADIASEQKVDAYRSIQNSPNMHGLFNHLTEENQYNVLCKLSKLNLSELLPQERAGIALAVIINTYTLQILHNIQNAIDANTTTLPNAMYDCLIDLFSDSPYAVAGILTELNTKHPNLDTDALCIQLFSPYFKFSATENKQIPEKIAAIAHTIAATRALDYIPYYKKESCTNDLFKMCLWLHKDNKHKTILDLVIQSGQNIGNQDKQFVRFFNLLRGSLLCLELPNTSPLSMLPIQPNTDGFYTMLLHHFQTPPINCYKNNDTPV